MKETNLTSVYRLKARCCYGYALNSRVTFLLLFFMTTLIGFAQPSLSSSEFSKKKQLMLDAKPTISSQDDRILLDKFPSDVKKMKELGYTESQILENLWEIVKPQNTKFTFNSAARSASSSNVAGGSDNCAAAPFLYCYDGPQVGNTVGAVASAEFQQCTGGQNTTANGVWYKTMNDDSNSNLTVTVSSGDGVFFPQVFVYSGACGAFNCQGTSFSSVTWFAPADDIFYIFVTGFGDATGDYNIEVTSDGACEPPIGDGLSPATGWPMTCGNTYEGTTVGAAPDVVPPTCGTSTIDGGVWYTFTPSTADEVTVSTCNSILSDTKISVFSGDANNPTCVGGNDDACGSNGFRSSYSFIPTPNVQYYVYVSKYSSFTTDNPFSIQLLCDGAEPPIDPNAPANDRCSTAIDIDCNSPVEERRGTTTGASRFGEVTSSCAGFTPTGPGVWYFIQGDNNEYTINTCNSYTNYDTKLFVYEGACGSLSCVTSNDDMGSSNCSVSSLRSEVIFNALAGTDYYLYVSGFGSNTGNFELNISCDEIVLPPDNDLCSAAEPITCGVPESGTTAGASADASLASCGGEDVSVGPGVWYTFLGNGDAITVDTNGSDFDTVLAVFTGSCGTFTCVDGDDASGDGEASSVSFISVSGTTYYIYVTGDQPIFQSPQFGNFVLNLNCTDIPDNDTCATAEAIDCGQTKSGNTNFATNNNPGSCNGVSTTAPGLWYVLSGNDQIVTASLADSDYDTKLSIYTGSCAGLVCFDADDDGGPGLTSELIFYAQSGTDYYIYVHGFSSNTGSFNLSLTCSDLPANDLCGGAIPISCGTSIAGQTSIGVTADDAPESDCYVEDSEVDTLDEGVWYTFTGTGSQVILSTCGNASFDTKLSVFTGECGNLTCFAGNDDAPGCSDSTSELTMDTVSGVTYYVYVSGSSDSTPTGSFVLTMDCVCVADAGECAAVYLGYAPTESVQLTATVQYGDGNYSYAWTGPDIDGPANQQTITVSPTASATYTVVVTDGSGCTSSDTVYVQAIDVDCDRNDNSDKVTICHNGTTLCVSQSAVDAHIAHGDSYGACGITLECEEAPLVCDTFVTSPANGATDVALDSSITWSAASGFVTGYIVTLDNGVSATSVDVGAALSYSPAEGLEGGTQYVVTVTPYNPNGNATGCLSSSFETITINDSCEDAVLVGCGTVIEGTTTLSEPNPVTPCSGTIGSRGAWYRFDGDGSQVTASFDADFDSEIVVFEGACGSLIPVDCADDNFSTGVESLTFIADAGTTYYFYIAEWWSSGTAVGDFTLTVTCQDAPEPIAGNYCGIAIPIDCDVTVQGTTNGALYFDENTPCALSDYGQWYTFVGTGDVYTISSDAAAGFDHEMAIMSGSCGNFNSIACRDGAGSGGVETYTLFSDLGTTYYIYIAHYDGTSTTTGDFELSITCETPPEPIPGNTVETALPIACGNSLPGSTVDALPYVNNTGCSMSNYGVWYTFVGNGDVVNISVNASYDTELAIVSGAPGNLSNIACKDLGNPENHTFTTIPGVTYYAYIAYWLNPGTALQTGTFTISMTCTSPPANDNCSGAINVPVVSGTTCSSSVAGTTIGSSQSLPGCIGTANDDVWYSFVATGSAHSIIVNNTGGSSDIVTEVFDSCGGTSILCQDTPNSPINLTNLTAGNTYYFRIYTWSSSASTTTSFNVCVGTTPQAPANQVCSGAINVTCGTTINATTNGTTGVTNTAGGCTMSNWGTWYTFIGDGSSTTVTTVAAAGYDHEMKIARGSCGSLVNVACRDSGFSGGTETATFTSIAGEQYYVYVAHYSNSSTYFGVTGNYTLTVSSCASGRPDDSSNTRIDWSMAPNPTRGNVTLDLSNYLRNNVTVEVIDFTGKVISSESVRDLQVARYTLELNSSLPSGMYFVRVASNSQVSSKKLVIMR